MSSVCRIITIALILTLLVFALPTSSAAQSASGALKGQITDPSGAVVVGATVTVKSATGQSYTAISSKQGSYEFKELPAGKYNLTAVARGFTHYELTDVTVEAGTPQLLDISFSIAVEKEQINVEDQSTNVEVDPSANSSATIIKGKDLDALSDDPDELASELQALAGPSAGPNGGQIYIDGFTNGQLPPKNAIREIRVNQNPFSAQFDRLGYGRVEVFTKPGMDKFHGQFMFNENNSALNSLSPFSPDNQPNYHSEMFTGNVSGPINKKSSFFFNVERRNIRDVSVITANILDENQNEVPFNDAVPNPRYRTSISPRLDYQLTPNNTMTVRYQYNKESEDNNGVGGRNLATQAFSQNEDGHNLTISDTQVISPRVINETRFQWYRDREAQSAVNQGTTIVVRDNFTTGGNSIGTSKDITNRYEFQNYTSMAVGKHFVKYGARARVNKTMNDSRANLLGTYTFVDIDHYKLLQPSQFIINEIAGSPVTEITWADAGLYLEDDWKIRPNFTLSYGLRYETQNYISDHADFAPRIGFAWGLGSAKSTPKTVLRAGFGMFYDRFSDGNVLRAQRNNGVNQVQFVIADPEYCAVVTPTCPDRTGSAAQSPTIVVIDPKMQSPYMMQTAVTLERQITKTATASVTYLNSRGEHTFVSQNINAPDPVTGIRPLQAQYEDGNVYQYESRGTFRQNQLIANTNIRMGAKLNLFSFYSLNYANSDTSGAGSFPSSPYDIAADYGRASFDVRHRFMIGGNFNLPYRFSLSPFIIANAGSPYNVTIGDDVNGDSIFNDRPSFAPAGVIAAAKCDRESRTLPGGGLNPYCNTPFGVMNMVPSANDPRIAINSGTGPSSVTVNLRVSKAFGFGKEAGAAAQGQGSGAGGGDHRGGPGGGGHGPGGPGGGMMRGGPGGPMGGGGGSSHRYNLTLSASARNLFNHVNLGSPVGNLSSTDFGKSISLAGGPFGSNSANRRIDVQVQFAF